MRQPGWQSNRRIRFHGDREPFVIVLHGGPGGAGGAVRLAQGLSPEYRVIEPWQRRSGGRPLTVAVHVEDLHDLIRSRCSGQRPALVGTSWGAMLALAYAAAHAESIEALVLVGCGTFDKASRQVIVETRSKRITEYIAKHPEHAADLSLDTGDLMMKWHQVTDSYEPAVHLDDLPDPEPFDMRGHTETWADMVRCQEAGIYPQSFVAVSVPAIMLHGAYDPHPGPMIRDNLRQFMPHLEYRQFEWCGHEPEVEKHARDEFFAVMIDWLRRVFQSRTGTQNPSATAPGRIAHRSPPGRRRHRAQEQQDSNSTAAGSRA